MDQYLNVFAQIFGTIAILCSLIIYSRRSKSKLLIFKCFQDLCWLAHYLLLSVFPSAASSFLCVGRSVVFYRNTDEKQRSKFFLGLFLCLYAISALLTWKNIFSIIPAVSSSVSTVAFWMKKTKHIKMLSILASLLTLSYNVIVVHSITVYAGVTFTILTSVFSLLKLRNEEKSDFMRHNRTEEKNGR